MKQLCIGIVAHVDAGKTSLTEAMLYRAGVLRKLGRVDHGDAFLDTNSIERDRGITIFSKQARLTLGTTRLQLVDTPGHVDFSAETERALQILDCAILVISGTDGIQAHTRTLWRLLERYHVPTVVFLNKMDLPGADKAALLAQLRDQLSGGCVDFSLPPAQLHEEAAALGDEALLERYLERGSLTEAELSHLVGQRQLIPCWFGSALRDQGVDALLDGLARYVPAPEYGSRFGALVYKVSRDGQGTRLTWLKVTGGVLKVKDILSNRRPGLEESALWSDKADQLRLYSGDKYELTEAAPAGTLCAVTGLSHARPGDALGAQAALPAPALEPVLTCQVLFDRDPHTVLPLLRQLEEEDPQLHLCWQEQTGQLFLQVMGEVQLEVLTRMARERFGLELSFGPGAILYRETIAAPVIGIGHFEPLRHYAEVHLLLEPAPRGSGLTFASACSTDQLDLNWQRLVLTHLAEREHPGVLTGSPITDMKITLIAGRAHDKHTEGGDFRQATYRAVRQGLMQAESILLEPWYDFRLEVPAAQVGRAMSDLERMGGQYDPPAAAGEETVLTGRAPVAALRDYPRQVAAYTRGLGRLQYSPGGYRPCADQQAVTAALAYDPERDAANPSGSVFCDHGSGTVVDWRKVPAMAHVDSGLRLDAPVRQQSAPPAPRSAPASGLAGEKELMSIFEQTYGKVERRSFQPQRPPARRELADSYSIREQQLGPDYLLVDGYNIIFAWPELQPVARDNLDAARKMLLDILANYRAFRGGEIILVFDAYKVKGNPGSLEKTEGVYVAYTKEAQTADAYIERATYDLARQHRVRVATSDGPEQLIILGHGALRLSALQLRQEIEQARGQISALLAAQWGPKSGSQAMKHALEQAQKEKEDKP